MRKRAGSWNYFVRHFEPITIPGTSNDNIVDTDYMFESGNANHFAAMLEFAEEAGHDRLWTMVDIDGKSYIEAGLHYVNRIAYFVTNKPWTDPNDTYLWG